MKYIGCLKCILKIFIIVLCITGCQKEEIKRLKVAALLKSSTNPFFALMWEGIKKEADQKGIEASLHWPQLESDFQFQTNFLKNEAKNFDALIIAPSYPEEAKPLLPALKKAGKKIIVLDEAIPMSKDEDYLQYYDSFIATDNAAGGGLVADFSNFYLKPNSSVAVIAGFDLDKPRTVFFKKGIFSKFPKIKLKEFIGQFDRQKTRQIVKENFDYFKSCTVIYCANDHMALGVVDAFESLHIHKLPVIIGYDSIREAQNAILAGKIAASIIQYPARMGTEGIDTLWRLFKMEAVSKEIFIAPDISLKKAIVDTIKAKDLPSLLKERAKNE